MVCVHTISQWRRYQNVDIFFSEYPDQPVHASSCTRKSRDLIIGLTEFITAPTFRSVPFLIIFAWQFQVRRLRSCAAMTKFSFQILFQHCVATNGCLICLHQDCVCGLGAVYAEACLPAFFDLSEAFSFCYLRHFLCLLSTWKIIVNMCFQIEPLCNFSLFL